MESFWKGRLSPITKHVQSVRLVLLSQMSQEDWNVLDYNDLRPSARTALDEAIIDGQVAGFYRVDVDMHKVSRPHGGKQTYFYPAFKSAVSNGDVPEPTSFQDYNNFDNAIDQDQVDTSATERLSYLMFLLKSLSPEAQKEMMDRLNKELPDFEDMQVEILAERDRVLMLAISLFLMGDARKAEKILRSLDAWDDDLYALFNDTTN